MDRIICLKSSKTGRSVEYSFTEFEDEETERIAAKTLNNYILFEKILKWSFEDKKKMQEFFWNRKNIMNLKKDIKLIVRNYQRKNLIKK